MAKLFRDGGYSYDQSKHLIADGTMSCSTGNTSSDQSWSRREAPELYRIRLHVSACYPITPQGVTIATVQNPTLRVVAWCP